MLVESNPNQAAFSETERTAVYAQLERLLGSRFFHHSRRFPAFLRFVVEHTLEGTTELLKERTLGVQVFGKDLSYDTGADPIVRVTAAEIRKRLAQYYQVPEHRAELRLTLPPGSYVPQFSWPDLASAPERLPVVEPVSVLAPTDPPVQAPAAGVAPARLSARHLRRAVWGVIAGFALMAVLLAALPSHRQPTRSALDLFWQPILSSAEPVLFCIADQSQYTDIRLRDAADPNRQTVLRDNLTAIVIDDLSPTVRMAGLLESRGRKYSLRGEQTTTLNDLRSGPAILIGAYDNGWTLRLLKPLRYHFFNDAAMTRFGIVDTAAKTPSTWTVDRKDQFTTNTYRDYALVARYTDATTGKPTLIAAGVGRGGTIAAGEFLGDPADLARLEQAAGSLENKGVEVVLSTAIIDGEPGTPRIEAFYTW